MYLVGHGSFQEPRLIELQYHRIMRYIDARGDKTDGSPDIFVDLNSLHGSGPRTLDQLPNLVVLRERTNNYTRIFIDIEDSDFDNLSPLVRAALEGRGPKVLNVFYDDENILDRKLKGIYGNNARVDDITDGSDFTCFFPTLVSSILEAALRQEIVADNPPSIWERILSLKALKPYRGGKQPFIEDRLSLEWKQRSK
ncbi:MAG: hypothetical protein WBD87_06850 [Candidatus Acidiferrales bacterium]